MSIVLSLPQTLPRRQKKKQMLVSRRRNNSFLCRQASAKCKGLDRTSIRDSCRRSRITREPPGINHSFGDDLSVSIESVGKSSVAWSDWLTADVLEEEKDQGSFTLSPDQCDPHSPTYMSQSLSIPQKIDLNLLV